MFLLAIDHKEDGTAHLTYDVGVSTRTTVVVPESAVPLVLEIPAEELLRTTLALVRPPANRRGTQ